MKTIFYSMNEKRGYILVTDEKLATEWKRENGYIKNYEFDNEKVDQIIADYENGLFDGCDINDIDMEDELDMMKEEFEKSSK